MWLFTYIRWKNEEKWSHWCDVGQHLHPMEHLGYDYQGSTDVVCVDSSEAALELLRRSAAMNSVQNRVRRRTPTDAVELLRPLPDAFNGTRSNRVFFLTTKKRCVCVCVFPFFFGTLRVQMFGKLDYCCFSYVILWLCWWDKTHLPAALKACCCMLSFLVPKKTGKLCQNPES